jgi:RLL motif-containing protein 1
VADWLAGHAVALAAADAGEGVADATAARVAAGRDVLDAADAAAAGVAAPAFADAGAEDTLAALHDLSSALGVTAQSAGDPAALADACVAALTDRVLPAAALLGAGAPSADPALALLASVPLGFTTGDAGVDRAAAALRFLYVRDLAALQARVDAAIGAVQAFTANPRTDTRLGKVGR